MTDVGVLAAAISIGAPRTGWPSAAVDVHLRLRATRRRVAILPGRRTDVWSYRGKVLAGDSSALDPGPGSYLGPTIRLRRGQRVRIDFVNRLPEESIVHWHGLHVPADMDGHPRFAVPRGESYRYEFVVDNRAGTYWYHPHPHRRTGPQVYYGLAGLLVVSDDEEDALGLPSGARDLPVVVQDRHLDGDNQLLYGGFGPGPGHTTGFAGDRIFVNGQPDAEMTLTPEPHRLRVLNGSNSRIYKLAWQDGSRITVIGTDGGLLRRPVRRAYVTLAPGQRVDLWVDFGGWGAGSEIALRSEPFQTGMFGFGPRTRDDGHDELPVGDGFEVLRVRVEGERQRAETLPESLSSLRRFDLAEAVNASAPRQFLLEGRFGSWTINGRQFELERVAADERVGLSTTEAWDIVNEGGGRGPGGMMNTMGMPHPMHIHGQQFQVLDRDVSGAFQTPWRSLADGLVDEGWLDTVLVMPGERVRLLRRFDDHEGLFLLHCHNLEHEDLGMMRNFEIVRG